MSEQKFGARRCRDARKPRMEECPEVEFYYCPTCHSVYTKSGLEMTHNCEIVCCGNKLEELQKQTVNELDVADLFTYKITGGYNDNAVQVNWKSQKKNFYPKWIYLKTFTGGYLKYVHPEKRPPMVFALADLDAFAYCDESPCLECTFRCKRGFVIYIFVENIGLIHMPLDKMNPYWQSQG